MFYVLVIYDENGKITVPEQLLNDNMGSIESVKERKKIMNDPRVKIAKIKIFPDCE